MKISDIKSKSETLRIELDVNGEACFISVARIGSRQYAKSYAWLKSAYAAKIEDGVALIVKEIVCGEEITTRTDEYERLEKIMFAQLITGWGFDDELTLDNAANLLINNPDIAAAIDEEISQAEYKDLVAKKSQLNPPKES